MRATGCYNILLLLYHEKTERIDTQRMGLISMVLLSSLADFSLTYQIKFLSNKYFSLSLDVNV